LENIIKIAEEVARERIRGATWSSEAMAKAIIENGKELSCEELESLSDTIIKVNPVMGSLYNLSLVLRKTCSSGKDLAWGAKKFIEYIQFAKKNIIDHAQQLFRGRKVTIFTISNSSNIFEIIKSYKDFINRVNVAESLPGGEGVYLAKETKRMGVEAKVFPDSATSAGVEESDIILIGADNVTIDGCVFNKVGSKNLAIIAGYYGKPMIAIFEPFKINPNTRCGEYIPFTRNYRIEGYGELQYNVFDELPSNLIDSILSINGMSNPSQSDLRILHNSFISWFSSI